MPGLSNSMGFCSPRVTGSRAQEALFAAFTLGMNSYAPGVLAGSSSEASGGGLKGSFPGSGGCCGGLCLRVALRGWPAAGAGLELN